jgi:integrase/recombinase XerD
LQKTTQYCEAQAISCIPEITPGFLRQYLLTLQENHNPGGVHAAYRSLRALFRWVEFEEIMPDGWKNPMEKVRAPKVNPEPIEPISIDDIEKLLGICSTKSFSDLRDQAIFLFMLDTGIRAQEVCDLNCNDVDFQNGRIMIKRGKGGKSRAGFISGKVRRALTRYLRKRTDQDPALFVSVHGSRLTYDGLRQILERRSQAAGLTSQPTLHKFRRAFALSMLRSEVDVYSLQKLMGHADLSVLRRYLAQNEDDILAAHRKGSPVENHL